MKIRFRWILTVLAVLPLIPVAGSVVAAPVGVPQQMMPGYVPASPSRGVASFRPRYRPQPVRPMARFAPPGNIPPSHAPVRRVGNWPLPVSYRPAVSAPRAMPPYGYGRQAPRWAGYRPPVRHYGSRPVSRPMYRYPARPPVGVRGYPRAGQFQARPAYPPVVPMGYRPPNRIVPGRAFTPRPYHGYPRQQPYPVRSMPVPRALPGRFAGRYQPYSSGPGGRAGYQFRPMPQPVAYRAYPMPGRYGVMPGRYGAARLAQPNYRGRPVPRQSSQVRRPVAAFQARRMPDRPISRGELLAWRNTAQRLPGAAY